VTTALILVTVVVITIFIVLKLSTAIGTQLHGAEKKLMESEEYFRSIFENNSAAICIIEPDTRISMVNCEYCKISGYTKEEAIGISWTQHIHPEDLVRFKEINRRRQKDPSEAPDKYEFAFYKKNGEIRHALVSATILSNKKIIASFVDITETKKVEKALSRQNSMFNTLLNNLHIGVYMIEVPSGKPLLANKASFDLLGRGILPEANSRTLTKVYDLYKSNSNNPYPNEELPLVLAMRGISKHVDDMEVMKPDGTRSALEVFGSPIMDEKGNIWAGLVSFQDITERKRAENRLKENEKQLLQLNIDKDRFISILGHDLKSPFNNIFGFSELLTKDIRILSTDEIEDIANNINKSARITNNLLEDILMWARAQHGNAPFKPQKLNFADACSNVIEVLNPSAYAKGITIYQTSDAHINVYADPDMLKTILLTLYRIL
jgi:PAS domain S-box-containing protein